MYLDEDISAKGEVGTFYLDLQIFVQFGQFIDVTSQHLQKLFFGVVEGPQVGAKVVEFI